MQLRFVNVLSYVIVIRISFHTIVYVKNFDSKEHEFGLLKSLITVIQGT